jgi:HK97 family phage major capsid protein
MKKDEKQNGVQIDPELQPIYDGIKDMQEQQEAVKTAQEQINKEFEESKTAFEQWRADKDDRDKKNQQAIDELLRRSNGRYVPDELKNCFDVQLKLKLSEQFEAIKGVRIGHGHSFDFKADMNTTNSITGSLARQQLAPSILPNQIFNFRDLVDIINTSTGLIVLPRETTPTGSASRVPETATATSKPQIEPKFTMVNYTADYIAGYTRVSKQMLQDLQFLQSYLPRILLREFYKAENTQFYTDLTAVASGSTTTSATIYAEKLIDYIANLGVGNFAANAIVGTFAEWASLMKTISASGTSYSLPGGMTISPNGTTAIAGIPFRPANWVATGKTITGDWTQAMIAVADSVKVEFFEQDQDNVIKNLITVRVEAREVLVIEQPGAFVYV